MRMQRTIPLVLCLALGAGAASRAEEIKDAREVIRRGVEALGGEAVVARCKAMTFQVQGKLHFRGACMPFTARFLCQPPSHQSISFSSALFKATSVLTGDK